MSVTVLYIGGGHFFRRHCIFKFLYGPLDFPFGANLYQKLPFLTILGAVSPHFYSRNGEGLDLGLAPPRQIL